MSIKERSHGRAEGEQVLEGENVLTAWRRLVAEAHQRPWLMRLLLGRGAALIEAFVRRFQWLLSLSRQRRRAFLRRQKLGLAGTALLLALSAAPVSADTLTVNGNGSGGTCSLVDAILAANGDATVNNCVHSGTAGADTIDLQVDVTLMDPYAASANGLPPVTSEITVEGNNRTISRHAGASVEFRIFEVEASGALTLNEVTISGGLRSLGPGGGIYNNGTLTVTNSLITGNEAEYGGGLANYMGDVTITNSTLSGNTADYGGGIANYLGNMTIADSTLSGNTADYGGGLISNMGDVTIADSILSGNTAYFSGGGIARYAGTLTVTNISIFSNTANLGAGGGIYNILGPLEVTESTIFSNTAYLSGGGIANISGTLAVTNSAILSNTAYLGVGGGIYNSYGIYGDASVHNSTISGNSAMGGGGIASSGTLTVTNSAISGNQAEYDGGGISNYFGTLTVTNSTISGNEAEYGGGINTCSGEVLVRNSTLSGNSAIDGGGIAACYSTLTIDHSTITGNAADYGGGIYIYDSTVVISRTLVSGNIATEEGSEVYDYYGGSIQTGHFNLFGHDGLTDSQAFYNFAPTGDDINATSDGANIPLADILNPLLADNGGPTLTHALITGSPAVDAIPAGSMARTISAQPDICTPNVSYDQRGVFRANGTSTGNACDIGSFEFGAAPTAVEILDFASVANWWGDGPQLHWETGDESELYGFHIWRGTAHVAETRLTAELIGAMGSFGGAVYTWEDSASFGWGQRVHYWLEAVGAEGSTFTGPVEVWGIGHIFLPSVAR
ncbi:MAG: hypothetical protein KF893_13390 [Caldilineaceae bacterium]|nr:hypothetical protein [Caldilineaceae bacterium]